jgi:hypothetical protein
LANLARVVTLADLEDHLAGPLGGADIDAAAVRMGPMPELLPSAT